MTVRRPSTTSTSAGFAELGVPAPLVAALARQGIDAPFPIQTATLPHSLAGVDVLGRGRTGSGKTYAFVLPVLARLAAKPGKRKPGRPRALILAPTRELANQIDAAIAPLAATLSLKTQTIFGGVSPNPQIAALRAGVDILVACPGRLTDHVQTGHAKLDAVEVTVLDEADHMADLGFLPVVRRLLALTPKDGQRLLFSATLDAGVDVLVRQFLSNPVTHSVDSVQSPVSTMSHHVLHVHPENRLPVLVDLAAAPGRTVVFTRTKYRAKSLAKQLVAAGIPAVELHGNLGQNARDRNLRAFSDGTASTLVATDIAARGIHVDDVTVVVHADPPVEHKAYLHRSGRTARAGAEGTVVTLMTDDQLADVRDLTRKAGIKPTTTRVAPGHELLTKIAPGERSFVAPPAKPAVTATAAPSRRGEGNRRNEGDRNKSGQQRAGRGGNGRAKPRVKDSSAVSAQRQRSASGQRRGQTDAAPARRSSAAAFSAGTRAKRQPRAGR
nr:DEAD/DEAH box helicase [Amycolatopsis nigrescens]